MGPDRGMTIGTGSNQAETVYVTVEPAGPRLQQEAATGLALALAAAAVAAGDRAAACAQAQPVQPWGNAFLAGPAGAMESPAAATSGRTLACPGGGGNGRGGNKDATGYLLQDEDDEQQAGQAPNSGSHSTMEPSEWRMNEDQQPNGYSSQGQGMQPGAGDAGGYRADPRSRRNARQQEQNKQVGGQLRKKKHAVAGVLCFYVCPYACLSAAASGWTVDAGTTRGTQWDTTCPTGCC